jgi:hypothetical protein
MQITAIEALKSLEGPAGGSTAFVAPQELNETQRVLRRALELLGPNGEHWGRGVFRDDGKPSWCEGSQTLCILTAIGTLEPSTYEARQAAVHAVSGVVGIHIATFNDRAASFADVKGALESAIVLAGTNQPRAAALTNP